MPRKITSSLVALASILPFALPAHALEADRSKEPAPIGSTQATAEPTPPSTPEPAPHDAFATELAGGRIMRGASVHRALHFTFDDGPSEHTTRLLDTLEARHVHATFFLVARQLEHDRGARIARDIMHRGHTIGLHTYRHDDITTLDTAALRADFDRSERVFDEVFEARPWLVRPPYGRHDDHVDIEIAARGYTEVLWNITAEDGRAQSAEAILEIFQHSLDRQDRMPGGAGGIVVLHDTHPWVVDAMPLILDEIDARNCEALTADEELWDMQDDLSSWFQARGRAAANRSASRMTMEEDVFEARQASLRARYETLCAARESALSESQTP
jgi:peptidoglycan/xylan/chitin deacetylase (PgdA/CDA1 family)